MPVPVIIVAYDPRWSGMFQAERDQIAAALGAVLVAVEHMGSTAVLGLGAKPVIDILAGVRRLDDARSCIAPLAALGYEYVQEYEADIPDRRYFRKGPPEVGRTHHLHMVEVGGAFWVRHLLFRDYLRSHPEAASAYEQLKRRLAAQYRRDREGYTNAKTEFVETALARAAAQTSSLGGNAAAAGLVFVGAHGVCI